jgi:hypothetical protein
MTLLKALVLALPLLPAALLAQVVPLKTATSSELGFDVSSYRYEEVNNGAFFMANEGNKVGLAASLSVALEDDWFWTADARQAHGNVSYSSAGSGTKGSNPDIITEARITIGRDFPNGEQLLAPYFGLGYRHLYNDLRGYSTTGAAGYRRISHYTYMPLGITHRLHLSPQARFSTSLEYDLLLEGRQQSFLSDVNATSNDPINTQREGHGLRLTAAYETYHWSAGVYFHHWNIADSDLALRTLGGVPTSVIMEPQNTTREIGMRFRLRFN